MGTDGAPRRVPGWSRALGWFLARVVWATDVVGSDRVPREGAVVLAANHLGVVDGPVVFGVAPRGTHVLVKAELFRGGLGAVLRGAGQIPVDRGHGRSALVAALDVLRRGGAVGIFPEGNRGRGDGASVRGGVAWLAVASGAPVVPVAVLGSRRTGEGVGHLPAPRRRLVVEFGEPLDCTAPPGTSRRDAVARAADLVADALAAHVREASVRHRLPLPDDAPSGTTARS